MSEWLKTECGEFRKSDIKGVKLDSNVLPIPEISKCVMFLKYKPIWRVEVLINGVWTGATNYVEDKSEAQERLNNIMQEIKGGNNDE